jgi:uncharacterized protein YecT (DUF1311 family)
MFWSKPLVAMVLVAAGLLLVAPTVQASSTRGEEAGSSSQGPQPPPIKELFSPVLPCSPNTTVGQEGCAERTVLADDKLLMRDVDEIFRLLTTTTARRDFVSAQSSWLNYRTKDCTSQSDAYLGGSEQPVLYGHCLAADDLSRRLDLKAFFGLITQGLGKDAPTFP